MTVAERPVIVWTCDGCQRTANAWVAEAERPEAPAQWLVLDTFEPDPKGGTLHGAPVYVKVPKHFHEPRCLVKWLNGEPITVAGIGEFTLADVVGWTGSDRLSERVVGCRGCGSRDGNHAVGCSLHR